MSIDKALELLGFVDQGWSTNPSKRREELNIAFSEILLNTTNADRFPSIGEIVDAADREIKQLRKVVA